MRFIKRLLIYIVLFFVLLIVGAKVLFHLYAFNPPTPGYPLDSSIIQIKMQDNNTVAATALAAPDAKYTILYSHGDSTDIGGMMPIYKEFQSRGYNVFAYDYPGYGHSTGEPSEQGTYDAALASYYFLTETLKQKPETIILWGNSLGGAVALDLATKVPCAGLVLESTFLSAYQVYTQIKLLPFDHYDNIKKIEQIRCPVYIIHGQADTSVMAWQAVTLYQTAPTKKQYYFLPLAGHNNVMQTGRQQYWDLLAAFVKVIEGAQPVNFPTKGMDN